MISLVLPQHFAHIPRSFEHAAHKLESNNIALKSFKNRIKRKIQKCELLTGADIMVSLPDSPFPTFLTISPPQSNLADHMQQGKRRGIFHKVKRKIPLCGLQNRLILAISAKTRTTMISRNLF